MPGRGPDELFHEERIRDFLEARGLGSGPIRAERIGEGQSNVTFRVRQGDADLVLRRGPRPPLPESTHDMLREAALLEALGSTALPVPEVLAVCEDDSLLGVPFYVMPYVEGRILTTEEPEGWDRPRVRRTVSEELLDTLVALHAVPVDAEPIRGIGRPEGYLERQVRRFAALWTANTRRDLAVVADLAEWLGAHVPVSQRFSVVHGDYRLGNLMFAREPGRSPRTVLVLDWEMATLGDPLADLGYLLATSADPGAPSSVMQLSPVTRRAGYLTREGLAERYARATSLDLSRLAWYEVLALWKSAIFCEAIYTRWLSGERPGDATFAPLLERGVPELLEQAEERRSAA
ncbi:phosphotransferase family protein [Leucobacter weissii]|uniref:Phosphotransferase family protein n=1 Tax=Leucobacter weissii TaxID=1983706 RepID=A0A939MMY9_9MICO|nr:phosphotransferase family protein [Leucobacter weissii]MBO1901552.1 phosphotransferase family protein [Leucobacter weissii]